MKYPFIDVIKVLVVGGDGFDGGGWDGVLSWVAHVSEIWLAGGLLLSKPFLNLSIIAQFIVQLQFD